MVPHPVGAKLRPFGSVRRDRWGYPMPLIDTKAARAEHGYKLADGGGLHLFVTAKGGGEVWRQKSRCAGKEKLLSHGP